MSLVAGNLGPIVAGALVALGVGLYGDNRFWLAAAGCTFNLYLVQFFSHVFRINPDRLLGPQYSQVVEPLIRQRLSQFVQLDRIKDLSFANSNLFTAAFCTILYFVDPRGHSERGKEPPPAPQAGTIHVGLDPIQVQPAPFRIESDPLRVVAEPLRVAAEPVTSRGDVPTVRVELAQPKGEAAPNPKDTPAQRPRQRRPAKFTILQINDVSRVEGLRQGALGGLARVRTIRQRLEAKGPVFLLHAGDLLSPSVMSKFLRSGSMIRCLNLLDGDPAGYDHKMAVTLGNHEFDATDPTDLLGALAQSDFAWVSSNVFYRTCKDGPMEPLSRRVPNIRDTVILTDDDGGVRVGVFGMTLDYQGPDYVHYVYKQDGTAARHEVARRSIAGLRAAGADMIVALTHQDMDDDKALAARFPAGSPEGIDLIVGGHEHFNQVVREEAGTWISKADSEARTVNRIDVAIDADGRVKVSRPCKIVLEDHGVPSDPLVDQEVERAVKRLRDDFEWLTHRTLDEPIAQAGELLEGMEDAVRGRETALGDVLADSIRDALGADVAFINGGAIRLNDDIAKGAKITAGDLEGIFYYDNKLVTTSLKGEQLREALEAGVAEVDKGDGRFLHVSGVRFTYRFKDGASKPKVDKADVKVYDAGRHEFCPLDPERSYKVGTIKFLLDNAKKEGISVLAEAEVKANSKANPKNLYAVVRERFRTLDKNGEKIRARDDGPRIVRDPPKKPAQEVYCPPE